MNVIYNISREFHLEDSFSSMDEMFNYIFKDLAMNYPKFYKMDILSKLGVAFVDQALKSIPINCNYTKTGIILSTSMGCHLTDKAFNKTITNDFFPSPSLFVYTLPNIVVGEICIRNKWQGENMVFIQDNINHIQLNYANYMIDLLEMELVWNIHLDVKNDYSHAHIIILKK
jgi:hypothetical protein